MENQHRRNQGWYGAGPLHGIGYRRYNHAGYQSTWTPSQASVGEGDAPQTSQSQPLEAATTGRTRKRSALAVAALAATLAVATEAVDAPPSHMY